MSDWQVIVTRTLYQNIPCSRCLTVYFVSQPPSTHSVKVQWWAGEHNSPSYFVGGHTGEYPTYIYTYSICSLNWRYNLSSKTYSLYCIKAKLNKHVPYVPLFNKCQGVEGIMLTYRSVVLCSKLKDLSTDVSSATSEILGIDILLQPFLIIPAVSQNQSRLQRAKGQLLSYTCITERK